jgi:flagellar hook-associated protein 2
MTTSSTVANSLTSSLGINTGIDTSSLVQQLADATYGDKLNTLNSRISNANAQISAIASAKSSLDTFSTALTNLLQSTAYSGQPASSDPTAVSVTSIPGGTPTGLPAQIEVQQLAQAQVLQQTTALSAATDSAGTGTLTLTVGTNTYDLTLTSPANTLNDLVSAINNAKSGVTASVVTDKSGARLVLKGPTGQDNAFTLTAKTANLTTDQVAPDADLQRFVWSGTDAGMKKTQDAKDAKIAVDNVQMQFASNTVTTAIPNLSLDLNKAQPGTTVTIGMDQPTSSMSDLVQQIVTAYNTLKSGLNTAMRNSDGTANSSSGLLANDSGARTMSNALSLLNSTILNPDGKYKTLSSIGVSTNNDGTLTLDPTKLSAALADDPAGVTQMLNPTTKDTTHIGIAGALSSIVTNLEADSGPLASSSNTYTNLVKDLNKQLDATNTDESNYVTQQTTIFAAMQTQLLSFKSTQSYLEQQIAAWNKA